MKQDKSYFDIAFNEKDKSYDTLIFAHIAHCLYIGSLDTTNAGLVWVHDATGNAREIVRDDNKVAFINSVRTMFELVRTAIIRESDSKGYKYNLKDNEPWSYDDAWFNLREIMTHLHRSGIFGKEKLMIIWDWEVERQKIKQNDNTNEAKG